MTKFSSFQGTSGPVIVASLASRYSRVRESTRVLRTFQEPLRVF